MNQSSYKLLYRRAVQMKEEQEECAAKNDKMCS